MLSEYRSLVACGSKPVSATMNAVRIVFVMSAALLGSARNTMATATVKRSNQLFVIPAQAGIQWRATKVTGSPLSRGRRENGVTLTDLSMALLHYFTAALRRSTST